MNEVKRLKKMLVDYLEETKDPRFTQEEAKFDTFPYNKKKKKK